MNIEDHSLLISNFDFLFKFLSYKSLFPRSPQYIHIIGMPKPTVIKVIMRRINPLLVSPFIKYQKGPRINVPQFQPVDLLDILFKFVPTFWTSFVHNWNFAMTFTASF